jgi:menaquinone-9 beta-reductase
MTGAADVVISGGGIAGATLAILLGRAGMRVDLFDGQRFPRDKPCGEGLMPSGVEVLRRLGLADAVGGRLLRGIRYHGWGLLAESAFPLVAGARPTAIGQRRLRLDAVLFEAARATPGVRAFEGVAVEGAVVEGGRAVGLRAGGNVHHARLIVGADGPLSPVRRSLGLDGTRPRRWRVGLRTHFRLRPGTPQPDMVEVFMGAGHELYVTPLPGDETLVAALAERAAILTDGSAGDARATLARWIDAQPVLRDRLQGAEALTPVAGRSPLALRARAGFAPGAVLLGDAAGFIDPVTGGGMAQALLTAELLAGAAVAALGGAGSGSGGHYDEGWLARFDRRRRRLLRDYQRLTRLLLFLVGRPPLARATLRLMHRSPRLMSHLIGVAGGVRGLFGRAPGR